MAALNPFTRELVFKIVFYGPGLGGKTTTLQHIHGATNPKNRGSMVSLATKTDRTLYFDFLPLNVLRVRDMAVKLQLFTVPGQVYYAATRKLVLNGVDGIVFVADSQAARMEANEESLEDLNASLVELGRALSRVPHQFHWNKRDLADVVRVEELDRRLNLFSAPTFETSATRGDGVLAGLEKITKLVISAYKSELPKDRSADRPVFLDAEEAGLDVAIRDLTAATPRREARAAVASSPRTPVSAPMTAAAMLDVPRPAPVPVREMRDLRREPVAAKTVAPAPSSEPQPAPAPTIAPSAHFSLAELWPADERDAVKHTESLIGARDATSAVLSCDALLTHVLAALSVALGHPDTPRDAAMLALALGIDGARYVGFRASVRAARQGEEVTMASALAAFALVVEARGALDRVLGARQAR